MKRQFLLLLPILLVAYASPGQQVVKGPYLQDAATSAITIMWETSTATTTALKYGPTSPPTIPWHSSTLVTIHEVRLTGLKAATHYYYQLAGSTTIDTFTTARNGNHPFRFSAYGDNRTNYVDHRAVCEQIALTKPEFVLNMGDLVSDGRVYSQWGTQYFTPSRALRGVPIYTCLGNHEFEAKWYYDFFANPTQSSGTESWYTFKRNNVQFVVLNTNLSFFPWSTQYQWADQVLGTRCSRFKVVLLHHAPYTSGSHYADVNVQYVKTYLVPLFEQHKVDLVFCGHDHHYERSLKAGIYYIVTGGGGAPVRPVVTTRNAFSQKALSIHHHCLIDVAGKILRMYCQDKAGEIRDGLLIDKDHCNDAPDALVTPVTGKQANPFNLVFQWSDADGWKDLELSSLRILLSLKIPTVPIAMKLDLTWPMVALAAMSTRYAWISAPDNKTIRLNFRNIPWPTGEYRWTIKGRDSRKMPVFARSTITIQ